MFPVCTIHPTYIYIYIYRERERIYLINIRYIQYMDCLGSFAWYPIYSIHFVIDHILWFYYCPNLFLPPYRLQYNWIVSLTQSLNDYVYFLRRLHLKRGLFWYRHYPKLHQMVKYRSSRALVWTNLRQISLRVFFTSNKWETLQYGPKKHKHVFFHEKSSRNYMPHTKVGKIKCSNIIYSKLTNLIIHNQA